MKDDFFQRPFAYVERVNLKVGKLAAVVPESLRFCFEIITKDTQLEGAELNIEEVPVQAKCKDCGAEWTIEDPVFKCEKCGSGSLEIVSGQELVLDRSVIFPDCAAPNPAIWKDYGTPPDRFYRCREKKRLRKIVSERPGPEVQTIFQIVWRENGGLPSRSGVDKSE